MKALKNNNKRSALNVGSMEGHVWHQRREQNKRCINCGENQILSNEVHKKKIYYHGKKRSSNQKRRNDALAKPDLT